MIASDAAVRYMRGVRLHRVAAVGATVKLHCGRQTSEHLLAEELCPDAAWPPRCPECYPPGPLLPVAPGPIEPGDVVQHPGSRLCHRSTERGRLACGPPMGRARRVDQDAEIPDSIRCKRCFRPPAPRRPPPIPPPPVRPGDLVKIDARHVGAADLQRSALVTYVGPTRRGWRGLWNGRVVRVERVER